LNASLFAVVVFVAYLALVARIGPERAAYTTILTPVIAPAVSWLLEGYQWSHRALIGVPLILVGNVVIFLPKFGRDMVRRQPSSLQAEAAPGE
jgi:drug/metabolite transporter (DMT)-like permease